ncbi:MAG: MBL fold metallo-hydrolase [Thermodesulfobacteriota bacterium]
MIKVTCLGACAGVTGSLYLIRPPSGEEFLVDCGLFQGGRDAEKENLEDWGFIPSRIKKLVLTHAHVDHCGRIPKLAADGFSGKILATEATVELCRILLLDSAHIQEMNAQWHTRKNRRQARSEVQPLYTVEQAEKSLPLFSSVPRDAMIPVVSGVRLRFRNAGHILGSSIAELFFDDEGEEVKLVFSGDLGKEHQLIVRDPYDIYSGDYVFMESTYGDRLHRSVADSKTELLDCINYSYKHGQKVIIPAFAVERTQEIIYVLSEFHRQGKLPPMPVYLDSPLAIKATEIFRRFKDQFDADAQKIMETGGDPLDLPGLTFTPSTAESIAINEKSGPAIVLAGNGMCTAGRIKHHLKHNLWRPGASVVIVGFQAQGSTGRLIVEGASHVKIFGESVAVRARVATIGGFSAHGDQNDLLGWLGKFENKPKVFLVHGESGAKQALKDKIEQTLELSVRIPGPGEALAFSARELSVEKPGKATRQAATREAMESIIAEMQEKLSKLQRELPDRWARPKDGDHDLSRLADVAEELAAIADLKKGRA